MITCARSGYRKSILETRDINTCAALTEAA
jgi:hypothetical protein